jgi:hypothetical protein
MATDTLRPGDERLVAAVFALALERWCSRAALRAVRGMHVSRFAPASPSMNAVSETQGDYESILRVDAVDHDAIHLMYSTDLQQGSGTRHVRIPRIVLKKDLRDATMLVDWFNASASTMIAGSTAFGPSTAVLRALKSTGTAQLALIDRRNSAISADRTRHPNLYDYQNVYTLQRVGSAPSTIPVIVNGSRMDLPTVHARGEHMGDTAEFDFLDDENNPIRLQLQLTGFGSTAPTRWRELSRSPTAAPRKARALQYRPRNSRSRWRKPVVSMSTISISSSTAIASARNPNRHCKRSSTS